MSALVIVLLAALWAAILLPGALRARREHHPVASADGFARTMTALAPRQRPGPRPPHPARAVALLRDLPRVARSRGLLSPPATPAARRRRAILTGLMTALACSSVLGGVVGGLAWLPAGVTGVALVVYLALVFAFVSRAHADLGLGRPVSSARAAARAAAVRAAVARPPVGDAPPTPGPALRPLDIRPMDGGLAPAADGLASATGGSADAGAGAFAADAGASDSLPRIIDVSGNAGLVSIRTLPRAGG